jgi:hypothetical protein
MKLRYDRDEDVLMVAGAAGTIDHVEHAGLLISHLSANGTLLLRPAHEILPKWNYTIKPEM